jgi:histidinol dehydrogenase
VSGAGVKIARLNSSAADFAVRFDALLASEPSGDAQVRAAVDAIIAQVRQRGDAAVLEYAQRFDHEQAGSVAELEVPLAHCHAALAGLPAVQRQALEMAAARLRIYAEKQSLASWDWQDEHGSVLGQRVSALARVGIYVPGGKASYPSSVLMNAIPAKVAGVDEIIMTAPAPGGALSPMVLAAAAVAGVDRVFRVGGAQAIAALAYGTQTIPAVDKIVGPGNAYVAAAKRQVFGQVGIDMVAGPSEILIISDGSVDPAWLALDMCAQAEHDELAQSLLLSPDAAHLNAVLVALEAELSKQPRAKIIAASLAGRGALIQVKDIDEALALANRVAPEHLELALADAPQRVAQVRHAGAIFVGAMSPEAMGDYCAGPNHVLPTARSARFASPLGVYDFQKRSSVLHISPQGAQHLGVAAATLARGEGLEAHARSAEVRVLAEESDDRAADAADTVGGLGA